MPKRSRSARPAPPSRQGRGLARPVRTEQAEALAARDGQVDAGNRDDVAEALEQRATADR